MPIQTVAPRIRGFICLNAHPAGCAANVDAEIAVATRDAPGQGAARRARHRRQHRLWPLQPGERRVRLRRPRARRLPRARPRRATRPPRPAGTTSPRSSGPPARAGATSRSSTATRSATRSRTTTLAQARATGAKLDCVVYSLAAPKRTDARTGETWSSALKPIGAPYRSKSINLGNDTVNEVEIAPATAAEIEATRKVMGGEDFAAWTHALLDADLLAEGCRAVAYSYIGPELTYPIYRSGTIGKAKEDLEATTAALSATLRERVGGAAYVSVNKALVTQASAAIPVVPLYISALYRVMKEAGTHEGTAEQIARLFRDHLAPGRTPTTDDAGRIRIDDREMDPAMQAASRRSGGRSRPRTCSR